ncbi:MAG: SGNH/GDSL hydrolase family protein, partial [Deltaproteobacteria bacterium]|nr:SGNH/GDSL hydrolase family protein [Deltaproteobacteria bacterium]
DFLVSYQTNRYGFRGEFMPIGDHNGRRVAFLGDSFTFGFGVNDHETFINRLNEKAPEDHYLNFAVPGYSTDQQFLLLRRRVFNFRPDVVVLVTYLGNDLFDNLLPFPLQANRGKPYFKFSGNRLLLKNSPVPTAVKSKKQATLDLHQVVMGETPPLKPGLFGLLEKMKLFQMTKRIFFPDNKDLFPLFDTRFQPALKVYGALLEQMDIQCQRHNSELLVILMPGKSLVERPGSQSALFQEYLRGKIIEQCKRLHIRLLDLALHLKRVHMDTGENLYFPNDGHMNALGHKVTADYIRDRM